jgi:hypothetical protein
LLVLRLTVSLIAMTSSCVLVWIEAAVQGWWV